MKHADALREALSEVPLFAACSKRDLQLVARHMEVVHVEEGTVLMREGETGDAFYIALEGSATIERATRIVGGVWAGGFVGELALLDPAPRTATVVARTAMMLGVLDRRAFVALIRDVPALSDKLLRALARRLRQRDIAATTT